MYIGMMHRHALSCFAIAALVFGACGQADSPTPGDAAAGGPRTYVARVSSLPPQIDGLLDDPAWQSAAWTDDFVDIRGPDWPSPQHRTRAKLVWDSTALHVGAELEEPHLWGTLEDRDAIIYRDNDFEVFLDPDGDGLAYFELEINALGTEFDLFLDKAYNEGGRAHIDWDMKGLRSAVSLDGTLNHPADRDNGWTVEISIPWESLVPPAEYAPARPGQRPVAGDVWRVNFSRVQWPLVIEDGSYRKEREPVDWSDHPEENWVWSPQGEINMHIPAQWGFLCFAGPGDSRHWPCSGH